MTLRAELSVEAAGSRGGVTDDLLYAGWLDSELARRLPYATWRHYQQEIIDSTDRIQILLYDGELLCGGVMLTPTMDAQTGPSLIAIHQFVLPEYRRKFPYREVLKMAKQATREAGLSTLIWTHRKPSGRIYQTYMEV